MKGFDSTSYTINDFLEWHDKKQLKLSPKFQRRSVWKDVAKSFLIDSIMRKKPLPKIFIRQITDIKTRTTTREVVDGQQRLRTIIDFINDGFKVKTVHNKEYGNKFFSELNEDIQGTILTYKFSVDILIGVDDSEIMDIFARLNTYTTALNKQELINAEYYGYFKQLVYSLSHKYNDFWIENKIFTEYRIMRMEEVELVADLVIAMIAGIQNRKSSKEYYKKYDEYFENMEIYEQRFDETISVITEIFGEDFRKLPFKKPALFYSLFIAIYCLKYEVKSIGTIGIDSIGRKEISKLNSCLTGIVSIINLDFDERTKEQNDFVTYISHATSDISSRTIRTKFIFNEFEKLFR